MVRVVVEIEGGMLQKITASEPLEIYLVDKDVAEIQDCAELTKQDKDYVEQIVRRLARATRVEYGTRKYG